MLHLFDPTSDADNRLARIGYGAASPLWAPFVLAAGMGVGFWMLSQWTRRSLAAEIPGAPLTPPAPAPEATSAAPERPEQIMAHTPPPAEAPTAAPDLAPSPIVPPEHVMDHAPAESVNAPAEPVAEVRLDAPEPETSGLTSEEPGGKAALLAETSAAVIGETASFGGDLRADTEGAAPPLAPADDDGADLVDAAYAENFGPVPAPATSRGSRKRKVPPGTAPSA
jgi:hypothetical protein